MSRVPTKDYFQDCAASTGFKVDVLEKVYRLLTILERIHRSAYLQQRLALKGGTVLHGVVFGFKRLSIDIDFNYIGSLDRAISLEERVKIRDLLVLLFEELGYRVELTGWKYAEEQFDLRFVNSGGGPDRIKVEINYLERLPVLGTRQGRISHPFSDLDPVEVLTLTREELFAGKLRALVQRGTARDLFDAHLISTDQERTDMVRLRATFLLHMAMVEIDGRAISLGAVRKIDEKGARDVLVPMLPRSAKVNLSEMMSGAESLICPMLVLTDKGREFFDIFYGEGKIKGAGLFRGIDMEVDLSRHPALKWRLQQLREKGGPP